MAGSDEIHLTIEAATEQAVCAAERYAELAALAQKTLAQAESTLDRAHARLAQIALEGGSRGPKHQDDAASS